MLSTLRTGASLALGMAILLPSLSAQNVGPSVFQFDRDFHFGEIGTVIPGPLSTSPRQIFGGRGTLMFRKNQSYSFTATLTDVFANGTVTVTPDIGVGTYHVDPDCVMTMDDQPGNPGNQVDELPINRSGTIIMATRQTLTEESVIAIALQVGKGLSNKSLNGTYNYIHKSMEYVLAGLTSSSEVGTMTFDGAGTVKVSATQQVILTTGAASTSSISYSAPYSVASDGTLTVPGTNIQGAVAQDSEVFFLVNMSSTSKEVSLSVGVRKGQTYTRDMVEGSWAASNHELELGVGFHLPHVYTEDLTVNLVGTSTMAGSFTGDGYGVDSNPTGVTGGWNPLMGTWKLKPNGTLEILSASGTVPTLAAVSASGEFAIASNQPGFSDLILFLKTCEGSENYGTGTAGAGGIAPEIGMRGFPTLGNTSFELGIVKAVGGSSAVIPIATQGTQVGIPFLGGQIWVNPASIAASVGVVAGGTSGQAGAGSASLTLPIPTQTSLVGLELFSQGIVLDASAPVGLSMTGGFKLRICR